MSHPFILGLKIPCGVTADHDPVVEEYAAAARGYDKRWSFYVDATTTRTLANLHLQTTDRVLDVGCGTGELLRRIAARYPSATLAGLDPVREMLEVAGEKLGGKADLRLGWANRLPWEDASFDVVISCNMFHYITHPIDAIGEMARVLRPGGQLIITDWCDDYLICRACNLYLRLRSKSYYKTYRQSECLALLNQAGHAEATIERYKINWLWGLMTARATKQ